GGAGEGGGGSPPPPAPRLRGGGREGGEHFGFGAAEAPDKLGGHGAGTGAQDQSVALGPHSCPEFGQSIEQFMDRAHRVVSSSAGMSASIGSSSATATSPQRRSVLGFCDF